MTVTVSIANIKELRARTGAGMVDCKKALEESNNDVEKAIIWLREKGMATAAKKANRVAAEGLASVVINGNYGATFEVNSETDFASKNERFVELVANIEKEVAKAKPANLEEALSVKLSDGALLEQLLIDATATIGEKITLRRLQVVNKEDSDVFGHYIHLGGKIASLVVVSGDNEEVAKDIAMQVAALNPIYIATSDIPKEVVEQETKIQLATAQNDPELADKPEKVMEGIVRGRVNKTLFEGCLLEQSFVKDPSQKVSKYLASHNASVKSFTRFMVGEGIERKEENFADEVAKAAGK